MARKNDTPQKAAMREMMSSYPKQNDVKGKDGKRQCQKYFQLKQAAHTRLA